LPISPFNMLGFLLLKFFQDCQPGHRLHHLGHSTVNQSAAAQRIVGPTNRTVLVLPLNLLGPTNLLSDQVEEITIR
jgi:hypothetical protein